MQEIYAEPVKPELIAQRIAEIKEKGAVACGSLTPQQVRDHYEVALEAGIDILVIQGTVISAEHVSTSVEPLNLKEFIAEVAGPDRRRRLRLLLDRPAPDADRRRRRARRASAPAPPARPAACSGSASRRRRRSPTSRRPAPSTCWRPAST